MSSRLFTRRIVALALAGGLAAGVSFSTAEADGHVETIVQFDLDAGEFPEGVAVDRRGNVYASLTPLGKVVKIPAGTSTAEPFAEVPGFVPGGGFGLLGLATDFWGNVYGAVFAQDSDGNSAPWNGVWKFHRRTGDATMVPGTHAIPFPNSIAFDWRGNMYITDTSAGRVWRVPRGGSADIWAEDPLLVGTGDFFGFPIGANGIAVRWRTVYVGVTEQSSVVEIPIRHNGSAGPAEVFATLPGIGVDGIALSLRGDVYVASPVVLTPTGPQPGVLAKVDRDGVVEILATAADGLDGPTSVAFGRGRGNWRSVYTANFSAALGSPPLSGPSITKIDVGALGWPIP